MAVRTTTFELDASEAEEAPAADERVVELQFGGNAFSLWRRATAGQFAMLQLRMSRGSSREIMHAIDRFVDTLVLTPEEVVANDRTDEEGVLYAKRIEDGATAIGPEQLWDLFDRGRMTVDKLFEMIQTTVEAHSGFPTESSLVLPTGRKTSGRSSQGGTRSRG